MDNRLKQEEVVESEEMPAPPVLSLMIDEHEAIEKTVSLIKKELTPDMVPDLAPEQHCSAGMAKEEVEPKSREEFDGLTSLLENSNIRSAIKVVAGADTQEIIDEALVKLKSSETIDSKSKILSEGIKKLHANLSQSNKSELQNDPLFNMAIGLVGLRQNRRIL